MADQAQQQDCSSCGNALITGTEGIKCFSCELLFHIVCTDLSPAEIKLIKKSKSVHFCCDTCTTKKHVFMSSISDMRNQLNDLFKTVKQNTMKIVAMSAGNSSGCDNSCKQENNSQTNKKKAAQVKVKVNDLSKVQGSYSDAATKQSSTDNSQNTNDFTVVKHKKGSKPLIGTRKPDAEKKGSGTAVILKAADRKAYVYIGRLETATSADTIQSYIRDNTKINNVIVDKIESKGDFAAFKITCDYDSLNIIKDSELWPSGTVINRFFFSKKSFLQQKENNNVT